MDLFTVIDYLSGFLCLGVGTLIGFYLGKRRAKLQSPKAICDCKHPRSMHDAEGCQEEITVPNYWRSGSRNGRKWVVCACLRYDGPELIHDLFARPTLSE